MLGVLRGRAAVSTRVAVCRHASTISLKPAEALPGPKAWPIFGNTPEIMKNISKPLDESIWHKWYLKFGSIYKIKVFGGKLQVVVSDPAGAEALLRADGKYPVRGFEENLTWVYKKNNFPSSMFSVTGPEWKKIRSAASKQVVPRRVANFIPVLSEISDGLVDHLISIDQGNVADAWPQLIKWAFQGSAYFILGVRINNFKGKTHEFEKAAQDFIKGIGDVNAAPPLYKIYPTKPYKEFVKSFARMHAIGRDILKKKHEYLREATEKGVVDENEALSLLEQWVIEGKFTEEEAITQSCDMLGAGVDTTANTATFMLHEVARQPQLQEKIHQEITSIVGEKRYPSFEDLQKMNLVRNTVKETLRLWPLSATLSRIVAEDIEISGYHIPAKTPMVLNAFSISHSEEYFEDPHAFKPERWDRKTTNHDVFASVPFGFGQRGCYGRRLAELELYVLLTQIFRRFRLSTDQEVIKKIQATSLRPNEPVSFRLTQQ